METSMNGKVKSFIPLHEIEPQALLQAERIARLPFIHEHVALMPDVHLGKGATVGSVIATDGAIIPAAVGVDIGCGMVAMQTTLMSSDLPDSLDPLRERIEDIIPTGIGGAGRNSSILSDVKQRLSRLSEDGNKRAFEVDTSWQHQLGTLGGGNHFIELTISDSDQVWIVLHSGSRGIGNKMANQHMKIADKLMKAGGVHLEDRDLAYLTEGSPEFDAYIRDLHWAQAFAANSREVMVKRVFSALREFVPHVGLVDTINSHHNFTQQETHFGKRVWITRKGAVRAARGVHGIIPGSMATGTYIVSGLGNADSFESSPHGAGRTMSRTQAKKQFTLEDLRVRMKGISSRVRESIIDEHPDSYKDINKVIEYSKPLVRVQHVLRQVLNVKGD
jgi:tRNA-splicing ligase RtcB (3'-phosphate/5'-hydroxy nucleic acid ligase)